MRFSRETYSPELIAEMRPLWEKHYEELAVFKHIPLDPDLDIYEVCAKQGSLRIFSARNGSTLCGYEVFFVRANPHYKTSLQAVQDILFLDKDLRLGLLGYRFIRWCDEELRSEGIHVVYQHIKARHDFSPLLERMGYELADLIYARRLN